MAVGVGGVGEHVECRAKEHTARPHVGRLGRRLHPRHRPLQPVVARGAEVEGGEPLTRCDVLKYLPHERRPLSPFRRTAGGGSGLDDQGLSNHEEQA